jgi:hypothetical protein
MSHFSDAEYLIYRFLHLRSWFLLSRRFSINNSARVSFRAALLARRLLTSPEVASGTTSPVNRFYLLLEIPSTSGNIYWCLCLPSEITQQYCHHLEDHATRWVSSLLLVTAAGSAANISAVFSVFNFG